MPLKSYQSARPIPHFSVSFLLAQLFYRRKECFFGFLGYAIFLKFAMLVGLPQSYHFHLSDERQDDGRWSEFT
jgi:hypothetical protein